MKTTRPLHRVLLTALLSALPILIVGATFWARASGEAGLEFDAAATRIDEGQAQTLAKKLKAATAIKAGGAVEVAMKVQTFADDVAKKAEPAATKGEPAAADTEPAMAQKQEKKGEPQRVRTRKRTRRHQGDVERALLDDAAKLATKKASAGGDAKKAGSGSGQAQQQARKGGDSAQGQASRKGGDKRPHASPDSIRGGARKGAKGDGVQPVGARKGGKGSLLRSPSTGGKGPGGSGGKGRR